MHIPMFQTTQWRVVLATGLGNIVEWYEFYLFAAMASVLGAQFLPKDQAAAGVFLALTVFGVGFVVRPVGALVFGRIGDLIGRKYTFLITVIIMGLATLNVGLLPGYASIGVAAPVIFVAMRMLQGLALGGEYGGAVTYVAEHAQADQRGLQTSWVQLSATVGLLLALLVVTLTRWSVGESAFAAWGWRIPFLLAFPLLLLSVWFRMSMVESPLFERMRQKGERSAAPLAEALGQWRRLRVMLLALFGLVAGQAVVWYAGQFYALFFLTSVLRVDEITANLLMVGALLLGSPLILVFGSLSDKIGRKPIIMTGLLIAALTYMPLFERLTEAANPKLAAAHKAAPVELLAPAASCSFLGNPLARETDFTQACDIARRLLVSQSVRHVTLPTAAGESARVRVGEREVPVPTLQLEQGRFTQASTAELAAFREALQQALESAGYPGPHSRADNINHILVLAILTVLVIYVAMVYGPMAAMLVELFPTRIRYTSVSVPYHIGNGWFGGLMPFIALAMVAHNGNPYHGLWYPVVVALITLLIGLFGIREVRNIPLDDVH